MLEFWSLVWAAPGLVMMETEMKELPFDYNIPEGKECSCTWAEERLIIKYLALTLE